MSIDEIREAKDELIRLSNDDKQRELYEMHSKILRDKISALNEAERKGIEKGIEQGIERGIQQRNLEIARNLLDILGDEIIANKTGLSIEVIKELREK